MKLNLETVLNDSDGEPRGYFIVVKNKSGLPVADTNGQPQLERKDDMRLKYALYEAVNAQYRDENLKPEEIYIRGKLARKVKGGGEKNFSADEITVLKSCMVKRYQTDPLFALDILFLIDPDNEVFKTETAAE